MKHPLGMPMIPTGYELAPEVNVYSWSPMPVGIPNGKSTQVHLHIGSEPNRILMRFKSARAIDELIDALVKRREDVWGAR